MQQLFGTVSTQVGSLLKTASCISLAVFGLSLSVAKASDCPASGLDHFVCDIPSAEDLVLLPDTPWLFASAYAGGSLLNIINTNTKSWQVIAPSGDYSEEHDKGRFSDCPGPVAQQTIVTHGLHLAQQNDDTAILYAVGHGAREAIEVFDIRARGSDRPSVRWIGCVPAPDGQEVNSVVSLANGDLLATIPLETGFEFAQAMSGVDTGAVYRWTAGTGEWQRLDVTAQPYGNGISVSEDETRFYVASSGLRQVTAYTNSDAPVVLGVSEVLAIAPDNLHRDAAGALITGGMLFEYTACNPLDEDGEFSLSAFATCPRPYQIVSVDPDTLATTVVIEGAANPSFSNITMGVQVKDLMWMGSFGADRVAYRSR
ncbi:MAG: hypothetical protein NWP69_01860 [Congregibacter sp.]|nr:hypothetical protein [Congregibacter sp.]